MLSALVRPGSRPAERLLAGIASGKYFLQARCYLTDMPRIDESLVAAVEIVDGELSLDKVFPQ